MTEIDTDNDTDSAARPPIARAVATGLVLAGIGFGGFGTWASTAPLASAAVAPGVIAVDGKRKSVQHLDGGIVAAILVREGDRVAAGQVLMRLDDLETRSVVALLETRYGSLLAQEARLLAERDGAREIAWPERLTRLNANAEVAEAVSGQERIFAGRRATLEGRVEVTRQRIAQLEAQIAGLEAQKAAGLGQMALIEEEVAGVETLFRQGLERKPRLLALQRQQVSLRGEQGDLANRVAQAREAITQAELEILALHADRRDEVAAELRTVQDERAEVEEKLAAARVRDGRQDVVAPVAGTVFDLRYFAPGAVVTPGAPIMDLVPQDDRLLVEARVRPTDIDVVHPGLGAKVVLSAFKSRSMPQLDAEVVHVSADALADERSGEAYYLARVVVDAGQLAELDQVQLQPGMPAETLIVTGERTMLDYLIQPVRDTFRHAFRED